MSNWAKIMACLAVLVCCLINLSLIQLAAGDSAIYKELKFAKDEKEVEAILKNAPNKEQRVETGLTVDYMEKMSRPSLDADQCEPAEIANVVSLLEDYYKTFSESLKLYVQNNFSRLIPVCIDNIEELFARELKYLVVPSEAMIKWVNDDESRDQFVYNLDKHHFTNLCNTICGLESYINNINSYEENITIEQKVKLFGEWWKYMDTCNRRRPCY